MDATVTIEKIRQALFGMVLWKSLRQDGFSARFYQKSWSKVGKDVCNFIRSLWENSKDIREVNYTDLCLIPKVNSPQNVSQFRHIALCSVIYKILSKIVVNRLKSSMTQIATLFQTRDSYLEKAYMMI